MPTTLIQEKVKDQKEAKMSYKAQKICMSLGPFRRYFLTVTHGKSSVPGLVI